MTYNELKEMARIDAIKAVLPPDFELADEHLASFPLNPDVLSLAVIIGSRMKVSRSLSRNMLTRNQKKDIQSFFNEFVSNS